MDQSQLMNLAIAAGVLYGAYHFGNSVVKTGAISVAALVIARQIPYVNSVV